jgi:DNA-binding SARP family transcriptional activator
MPLLGYLVLHAGAAIGRTALAAMFWPDEPEKIARTNLRRHLHQIARALPPSPGAPWIESGSNAVSWPERDDVWIDVREFERDARDPATHERALEVYRGDLLADYYEEWLLAERERLRAQYLRMCYDLALAARRDREYERALRFIGLILATDEWREDVVRLELAIRYEAGDRTGALAAYAQFATRLRDEMNVTPMPETVALRDAMLANEAVAGAGTAAAERHAEFKTPLVGRAAELKTLDAAWSRAARGSGTTVFVGGEAGVGKSRLVGELAAQVAAEGGRALFGGTSNPEAFPYEAVVDALRRNVSLIVESRIDRRTLSRLCQLLPELHAALPDLPPTEVLEPAQARSALFEAIARTVEQLSRTRPVVLVLEDLHWANAGTLDALEVLARRIGAHPTLIVATHRSEEAGTGHPLSAMRRRLQSERRASSLSVRSLDAAGIGELVRRSVNAADIPSALAETIYSFSEGNPLFANQLLRGFVETGEVPNEGAAVSSIAGAVLARIEALDARTRALAETAATAGRSFTAELAMRVLGWREGEVFDALAPLLDRGIVREAGGNAFAYSFSHWLIAAAVYSATPLERRRARHRRIAQVMTERGDDDRSTLATIARHWKEAGDLARAGPIYLEAARRAADVYAYAESVDYCTEAVNLTTDSNVIRTALLLRESAHASQGLRENQRLDLAALEASLAAESDPELAWEVLRRQATLARATDDLTSEVELLSRLNERADASKKREWLAEAAKLQALHWFAVSDARAETASLEALAQFERLEDERGEVESLCLLSRIEADRGDLERARAYLARARTRLATEDSSTIMNATFAAGYAANHHQDFQTTVDLASEALELARASGNRGREGDAINLIGLAKTRLNDFAGARAALNEARELFSAIGRRFGTAAVTLNLGILEWRIGSLDVALERMSAAAAEFREIKNAGGELLAAVDTSTILMRMGRLDAALEFANTALRLALETSQQPFEAGGLMAIGVTRRRAGDPAGGIVRIEEALAMFRRLERPIDTLEALTELAVAYALVGRDDEALAKIEELMATPDADLKKGFWPQLYYWAAAQVYRHCGEEKKAARALAAAVALVNDLETRIAASEDATAFAQLEMNAAIRSARDGAWPVTLS